MQHATWLVLAVATLPEPTEIAAANLEASARRSKTPLQRCLIVQGVNLLKLLVNLRTCTRTVF
jgi:hypothetical protein